ncbi:hypothetical protein ABTW24_24475 [Sphingobacterium thalpophilum]|uniref:Uncharacterized protein n=1 Tax=Sphingobacterium thalpophilum TaxID=259 RepID=A0ABV4HJP4_9SPHI
MALRYVGRIQGGLKSTARGENNNTAWLRMQKVGSGGGITAVLPMVGMVICTYSNYAF